MMLRRWKKCLILDHDDTVVDSTAHVHYPAYLAAMSELRPGVSMSLEEYFTMNCEPGIFRYYTDVVKLNREELQREDSIWKSYVRQRVPQVYPGMRRIILRQKEAGGLVCVVSHSDRSHVLRDYTASGLPDPDVVFGGDVPEAQRKPSAWPVEQILQRFGVHPEEVLVVDDLIPGFCMAQAAGVDCVAACWAHHTPAVRTWIESQGIQAMQAPDELERYLFGDSVDRDEADGKQQ